MIKTEYPYIDSKGHERKDLIRTYSDLGCRLFQQDTGKIFTDSVVDSVLVHHTYIEMTQDLGELPEAVDEPVAEEAPEVVPEA